MTARRAMVANALFSAVSAVSILAAREKLYPLFGLPSAAVLILTAAGLLLYAGALAAAARRDPPDRRALLTAAALDAGWVAGSAIVLLAAWTQLAPVARTLLVAAALIVEVFTVLQIRAARSMAAEVRR